MDFVLIYLRNLLLNWVVLVPLLASVLMIPRVANTVLLAPHRWGVLAGLLVLGVIGILLKPKLLKRWRRWWFWLIVIVTIVSLLILAVARGGWSFGTDLAAGFSGWGLTPQSALLVAGMLLGGYSLAYMRLNRPSNSGAVRPGSFFAKHRDQNSFLWLCLLPLSVSAVLLTTFWAWFRELADNADSPAVVFLNCRLPLPFVGCIVPEWAGFLFYGALLGLTCWFLYLLLASLGWLTPAGRREVRRMWEEEEEESKKQQEESDRQGGKKWGKLIGKKRRNFIGGVAKNAGVELAVTFLTSVIGAALLYAVAVNVDVFYAPVREAVAVYADASVAGAARPHREWWHSELYTVLAFPAYLLIFVLSIALFVGLTSRRTEKSPKEWLDKPRAPAGAGARADSYISHGKYYLEDEDREWLARASAWLSIAAVGWLLVGGLVIFGPLLFFQREELLAAVGGVSGLVTVLGGRSALTPGQSKTEGKQGWLQTLGLNLIVVASLVFFACIVVAVSLLTAFVIAWLAQHLPTSVVGPDGPLFAEKYPSSENPAHLFHIAHFPEWYYLFPLALLLHIFGRVASRFINLNKFSLHAGYRDRIIRAFLGASRLKGERCENPFTGFDPRDNLYMAELRPWLLRESDFVEPGSLVTFVRQLTAGDAERSAAATYLRGEIERSAGESRRFLKDPPESINTNASFRSALFGDLARILQENSLDTVDEFKPHLEKVKEDFGERALVYEGRDKRLRLNRLVLMRAFPGCFTYPPKPYRLMHVVNMALNLVGGDRLAWQQRRAESFTATPLHAGSLFVGYRPTRHYGGKNGISLGTAVAISGAAASSNMGYYSSSPFVTFIMTLFNARLGWWLGNPGVYGYDTYFRSHPRGRSARSSTRRSA